VITRKNLDELNRYNILILPDVLRLSSEESHAIKNYISKGGSVYASKFTLNSELAKAFGISYLEETKHKVTYIAPTLNGKKLLPEISSRYPLTIMDSQIITEPKQKDGVMATMVLPYTDPEDSKFVSIHTNPPGIHTKHPALIYRELNKGRILWSSATIETQSIDSLKHRSILLHVFRQLSKSSFSFEATAPECVEITMFHEKTEKRYLINLLNLQSEVGSPNIPIENIRLKVKLDSKVKEIKTLPEGKKLLFKQVQEYAEIKIPKLLNFKMIALDYE
ncbi:MAG: hypothetical protein QW279_02980, partial [Candidatus Jordarchaeaceae archaeon]